MLNKLIKSIIAFSVFTSLTATAADMPKSMGLDDRVTEIDYKIGEVYEIVAKPGIATHIVLERGEEHSAHAFGDGEAWHFTNFRNNIFIKPALANGTTNLSLITNKRDYVFKINFADEFSPAMDLYQVRFNYPEVESQAQTAREKRENIDRLFSDSEKYKVFNLDYSMKGDKAIAPINVWDDGTFTYFKFTGNTDMPSIYSVIEDPKESRGKETLVNKTVTGGGNNLAMMHKVHYFWRLRLGDMVLDIRNNNMNYYGDNSISGTISPDVKRVSKVGK